MSDARAHAVAHARSPVGVAGLLVVDLLARTSYGLCRTPLLPLYAVSLGADARQIGLIGAAATSVGIVVKFPAGTLSDVVGRPPLLLVGLLVFAFAPALYPLAGGIALLGLLRLFHGLATSLYGPVSMATMASHAGDRRGEMLSWLSNTKIAGPLLGAVIGGWILSGGGTLRAELPKPPAPEVFHTAWSVAFALGAAALAVGLFVGLRVGVGQGPAKKKSFRSFLEGLRQAAGNRTLVLVSATEGLQNVSVGVLEQFFPVYVVLVAGLSPFEAGALFGVQTLSAIACKPFFGRLSDRRGRRALIPLGLFCCAVSFAVIPWLTGFGALLVSAFVFGVGEALVTAAAAALSADVAEHHGLGAAMGVFGTIGDLGHASGPVLAGVLLAAWGWSKELPPDAAAVAMRPTFVIVATAMAAIGVIYCLVGRSEHGAAHDA